MPRFGRTAKVAAITVAGVAAIGGLSVAGALPSVGDLSGGHSAVETVPPDTASPTGIEHAQVGDSDNAAANTNDAAPAGPTTSDASDSSSRLDGLGTAAGNVTNDTASAVINTLINTEPGPGLGAAVAEVASDGHAHVPSDVPPATPDAASNGLSHRP
jgi:hypothetical protein